MNAPERFTLNMTRFIRTPREKVYDAFVTEAGLAAWMGPRGMKVRSAKADPQVGGAWRVEMHNRDGYTMAVGGQYKLLQRPSRRRPSETEDDQRRATICHWSCSRRRST